MAKAAKARSTKTRPTKVTARKVGSGKPRAKKSSGAKKGPTRKRSAAITVMGMAVPKTLTNALDSLVNSSRGREILASALIAAAGAAAAALVKNSDSPQVAKARDAASEVGNQIETATKDLSEVAAGALGEIVASAARSFLPASVAGGNQKKRSRD